MELIRGLRPIAGVLASATLLTACAGGSPPVTPQSSGGASVPMRGAANHYGNDFVYSAQPGGNDLSVYSRRGYKLNLKETLSLDVSAPQGIVATANGWLFVANGGDANVLAYQPGKNGLSDKPAYMLDDFQREPVDVDTSPDRDLVAVSNLGGTNLTGSLSVYLDRAKKPSRILTYGSDDVAGMGIALDHNGNCYWSFNNPKTQSGTIVEFKGCNGSGTMVVSGIPNVGGLAFDPQDNLYYVNETTLGGVYSGVYKCNPTSQCTLFTAPYAFGLPTNINFDYKGKDLWLADATGYLDAIDINTGELYKTTSLDGDPYGVAPAPGE